MLPFAAQGAGMAIEDAAVLAKSLSEGPIETAPQIAAALARYARQRRPRVARVQQAARNRGRIYHLGGPLALARDLTIRLLGPQRLLAQQNWIHDWHA
jgi:salicylate hydroxylase